MLLNTSTCITINVLRYMSSKYKTDCILVYPVQNNQLYLPDHQQLQIVITNQGSNNKQKNHELTTV